MYDNNKFTELITYIWFPTTASVCTTFFIYSKKTCLQNDDMYMYIHVYICGILDIFGLPQSFFSETSQLIAKVTSAQNKKIPDKISPLTFMLPIVLVGAP